MIDNYVDIRKKVKMNYLEKNPLIISLNLYNDFFCRNELTLTDVKMLLSHVGVQYELYKRFIGPVNEIFYISREAISELFTDPETFDWLSNEERQAMKRDYDYVTEMNMKAIVYPSRDELIDYLKYIWDDHDFISGIDAILEDKLNIKFLFDYLNTCNVDDIDPSDINEVALYIRYGDSIEKKLNKDLILQADLALSTFGEWIQSSQDEKHYTFRHLSRHDRLLANITIFIDDLSNGSNHILLDRNRKDKEYIMELLVKKGIIGNEDELTMDDKKVVFDYFTNVYLKNKIPTDEEWLNMSEEEQTKWYDDNGVSGLFRHTYENVSFVSDDELTPEQLKRVTEIRKKLK